MELLSFQLQSFVRESLNPPNLVGSQLTVKDFKRWRLFLTKEIAGARLSVYNMAAINRKEERLRLIGTANQVVDLSNLVHTYMVKYMSVWRQHPLARDIKQHYLFTCNLLNDLLAVISNGNPAINAAVAIPQYNLAGAKMKLKKRLADLTTHLKWSEAPVQLQDILVAGINQYIHKKGLTLKDEAYLDELMNHLLTLSSLEKQLADELIVRNFNLPEFFLYWVNNCQSDLADIDGLQGQVELLLKEKNRLYDLSIKSDLKGQPSDVPLYDELDGFLTEKIAFLKQMIKLQRMAIKDFEKVRSGPQFLINLPVPQFGLLIRMQIERGLLVKEHIGELFTFFATHFYTPHTSFISAESLQKKSTDVEFATAQKMKGHLIGMLNWLNTNFNLSNYS